MEFGDIWGAEGFAGGSYVPGPACAAYDPKIREVLGPKGCRVVQESLHLKWGGGVRNPKSPVLWQMGRGFSQTGLTKSSL